MADYYTNISFQFGCSPQEASDLDACFQSGEECELPEQLHKYWENWENFARSIAGQPCPDYIDFNLENNVYEPDKGYWISSNNPNIEAIAYVIRTVCENSLAKGPIAFEWSNDCSKPRLNAYGGGFCIIHKDGVYYENTSTRMDQKLKELEHLLVY